MRGSDPQRPLNPRAGVDLPRAPASSRGMDYEDAEAFRMTRRPWTILPFLVVALSIWASMHFYVYTRLIRDAALPAPWSSVVTAALLAGALSIFPAFARVIPRPLGAWIHVGAFGWMGTVFLTDTLLALGDAFRTILAVLPGTPVPNAPTQAAATIAVAAPLVATALWNARRDAPIQAIEIQPDRWPVALDGLRIVQLTDVHVSPDTTPDEIQRLVDRVNALSPHLITLTGDLVDGPVRVLEAAMAPLAGLRAPLGVFAVTGNHEYFSGGDAWIAAFERLGFRVLQNERVRIATEKGCFDLAGVPDWRGATFGERHRPRLADTLAGRDPSVPVILLAHQPRQFPEAAKLGVSLQLSGHTHGGQLWPFTLLVPLAERHVAGLHREGASQIYVSRGTRYWGPPMRLGAPQELTVITLRSA